MMLQIDFWQLLLLLISGLGALWGVAWGVAKVAVARLITRLDAIEQAARAEAGQWQQMERELLLLKADLPLHYVRREDYIRGQSVIESKLDALASKWEISQLRKAKNDDA